MKSAQRTIELLAPARNLSCGIEAIRCGADAVYIGAPRFGARAAAGNTLQDIEALVRYAHLYGVRVYVTMNTIVYEDELAEAEAMARQLADLGVDALITQDLAFVQMQLPIALHASTQMNNRTASDARLLQPYFRRLVLARELSLFEIGQIHQSTSAELEVFVHGALCVSLSGRCYASQACFARSANRGECAQFCRLAFNLEDADGQAFVRDKHLLSLRDMNRSEALEELVDAGVTSFKIEGRLKDVAYVKNVTAYYRRQIDRILRHRPDLRRASFGRSVADFTPQLDKTFSRGFTDYFLYGRTGNVASMDSPKSIGQFVGHVKAVRHREVKVAGLEPLHNGDGLCYLDAKGNLQGFRVNRVEGTTLHTLEPVRDLPLHTPLYRNHDAAFRQALERPCDERRVGLSWTLRDVADGFQLRAEDETGLSAEINFPNEKQLARSPQRDRMAQELSKLGGTCYEAKAVNIDLSADYFLPAARLGDWRRQVIEQLLAKRQAQALNDRPKPMTAAPKRATEKLGTLDYSFNVSNSQAKAFWLSIGVKDVAPAYELEPPKGARLMTCKHCIKHALGYCTKHSGKPAPYAEPWRLALPDGRKFPLRFNCRQCQMEVYADV